MALTEFKQAYHDDSDFASEKDEEKQRPGEDREKLVKSRPALGLSVGYVPAWIPRDAFREFYQNWFVSFIFTHPLYVSCLC